MLPKVRYLCDPEKNTGCRKINCRYNPKSPYFSKYNGCIRTSDARCAKTDPKTGEPMVAPVFTRRIP
jgi:hypothetical protein